MADIISIRQHEPTSPSLGSTTATPDFDEASRPRSSTLTGSHHSGSSQTPLRRMSIALRRVSRDFDRSSKHKDATRSSGINKYIPPPPLDPIDPALVASRLAWSSYPRRSSGAYSSATGYYETPNVRGSGYARYPTTGKPSTLRVEEHKVKGFRAVWRDFVLSVRLKLYRLRKQLFANSD